MSLRQSQLLSPYTVRVESVHRRSRIDLRGVVTAANILEAKAAFLAQREHEPAFDELWVYLEVTSLSILPEEMAHLVQTTAELVAEGRISGRKAIVVRREGLVGVAHLYKHAIARSAGQAVEVFDSVAAAEAWLSGTLDV
ncbi:MAG: hypothetical protein AAGJ10_09160 [Bacteroidota bacterium]